MRLLNVFVALFAVAVIATVVLVGVGSHYSSLRGSPDAVEDDRGNLPSEAPTLVSLSEPLIEKITAGATAVGPRDDEGAANLTGNLTAEIAKDIVARNPEGPSNIEDEKWINVIEPEKIADLVLADGLKNFHPEDFFPEVKVENLIISNEVKANVYLKSFQDILNYNFSNQKTDFSKFDAQSLNELVTSYNQAIKSFYNLEVPRELVSVHQKEIGLLVGQKKVFEVFANYEADPVRAILAAQVLEVLGKKFSDLNLVIAEFIKKNNVQI